MTRRPRSAVALGAVLGAVVACPRAAAITPAEMEPHRRTVADIAEVSSAIVAWVIDQVEVQGPAVGRLGGGFVDVDDYLPITVAGLEGLLVPTYLAEVPKLDGWGNPYDYRFDPSIPTAAHLVLIRSAGADGVYEGTVYTLGDFETLEEDLVWADGISVRRPGAPLIDVKSRALRARQEIVDVGVAMLAWYVDQPSFAPLAAGGATVDLDLFTPITAAALDALLVPAYSPAVPETDPWGTAYDYYLDTVDLLGPEVAAIRSRGRDGLAEGSVYVPGTFPALELDGDLVWADGVQVRQPDDISILVFLDGFEDGDTRHWSAAAP